MDGRKFCGDFLARNGDFVQKIVIWGDKIRQSLSVNDTFFGSRYKSSSPGILPFAEDCTFWHDEDLRSLGRENNVCSGEALKLMEFLSDVRSSIPPVSFCFFESRIVSECSLFTRITGFAVIGPKCVYSWKPSEHIYVTFDCLFRSASFHLAIRFLRKSLYLRNWHFLHP